MTMKIQSMTIILMTTIMLTSGVVPHSFATYDDDYEEEDVCQVPWEFAVMYDGPPNAEIEIYKKSKQAKDGVRVVKDFPGQTFSSGDYIVLNAETDLEQEKIHPRTVYKIMHGSDWKIISFNTSCQKPIEKYDSKSKGGITLTIDYGKDKDGDDVIYEKYRHEKPAPVQQCTGTNEVLLDFESDFLSHGSQQAAIQTYLSGIGPDNFEIVYDADSNGPVNDPGAIYDSRNVGGADEDLESPEPNPPIVGNMLIIQENNQQSGDPPMWTNPDDEASGGKQFLSFEDDQGNSVGVDILSWRNIDLEGYDETNVVTVKFLDGSPDLTKNLKKTGDDKHEIQEEGDFVNVKKIIYDLDSSGAITDICIRVPDAPTKGSITVTKVVEEENPSGNTFGFTLDGQPQPPIELGDGEPHTFPDLDPGTYVLAEVLETGYSLGITCPDPDGASIDNIDENAGTVTITLSSNENPSCTFTNTEIIPTTLTIKKTLTNDNGGDATPGDFAVLLTDIGEDGILNSEDDVSLPLKDFVEFTPSMGSLSFQMLSPGIYVFNETITDTTVDAEYTSVLVAGDTSCPVMENEVFTVKEGEDITCSIYNDDNFVPGGTPGPKPTVKISVFVEDDRIIVPSGGFTFLVGTESVSVENDTTSAPIEIDANTATDITQTNALDKFPSKIKGDGNCPEVLAGTITLSTGQSIECTMFYGIEVEPGVVFWFNTLKVDTTFGIPVEDTFDTCANVAPPCVDLSPDLGTYMVVDDNLVNPTTVILWSILAPFGDDRGNGGCVLSGIDVHSSGDKGFFLDCPEPERGIFHFNYALIEADINALAP